MSHFYHQMTRKYVVAFAHQFSDVIVVHDDEQTDPKPIKVPIIYATKAKMFYEIKELSTSKSKAVVNTYVPRMGFNITNLQYDATRKQNNINTLKLSDTESISYPGVPYNYNFELSILTKKQDDLFQILEQVAVKFTPDRTITIKEITGIDRDVSLNLDTINFTSIFEYTEDENRIIGADLTFTLKGHFYPRINVDGDGEVIKKIITNYGINRDEDFGMTVEQSQDEIGADIIKTITNFW